VTPVGHLCGPRASSSTWLALCHLDFGAQNLDIRASIQGSPPSWIGSPPTSYNSTWLQYLEYRELQCFELRPECHLQHVLQSLSYVTVSAVQIWKQNRVPWDNYPHHFCVWDLNVLFQFLGLGWDWVHFVCRPLFGLLHQPHMIDDNVWSRWWNKNWQGKLKYSGKTCPSATLSTTNPTWHDLGHCGGKPATAWAMAQPDLNLWSANYMQCHLKGCDNTWWQCLTFATLPRASCLLQRQLHCFLCRRGGSAYCFVQGLTVVCEHMYDMMWIISGTELKQVQNILGSCEWTHSVGFYLEFTLRVLQSAQM
jgi:hypothetical protein